MDDAREADITKEYLYRSELVDYSVNLPESEFEIMTIIWQGEPPFTTDKLMKILGEKKNWKSPTLISFLTRLEDRGFIMSYKKGKERYYIPLADRDAYINRVTADFVNRYHGGSLIKLLDSMYADRDFTDEEIDELIIWLKSR